MTNKNLKSLISSIEIISISGNVDASVRNLQFDSRRVEPGDAYFALKGGTVDGHKFISGCIDKGASVIFCEDLPEKLEGTTTFVQVSNARYALGIVANEYYGNPSKKIKLVGVTGTNGKTTVATLLYDLFSKLGKRVGLLSTVQNRVLDETIPSTHTTADALQICQLMKKMADANCEFCFMEVTSHAIDQHRIAGLEFDCAVFTNFSQDHLDYHVTIENYRDTKRQFFSSLSRSAQVISNVDDKYGRYMVDATEAQITTYGENADADLRMKVMASTSSGIQFQIGDVTIATSLVGRFNAYNLSAVFGVAVCQGIEINLIKANFAELQAPLGRMQTVENSKNVNAIVDFAHTPDGLLNALNTVRGIMPEGEKLVVVVGCGGDRDKDKRSEMGKIAAELANEVVFTSDNPRSEDPISIIDEMLTDIPEAHTQKITCISDRSEAIKFAVKIENATILVAGKGHEKFQEIRGEKIPFDDVERLQYHIANDGAH